MKILKRQDRWGATLLMLLLMLPLSVMAEDLPEKIVGVWAIEGSEFEGDNLLGGQAFYLDAHNGGVMVTAPLPVRPCTDGTACHTVVGFKLDVFIDSEGDQIKLRLLERNRLFELRLQYEEASHTLVGPNRQHLIRHSATVPDELSVSLKPRS